MPIALKQASALLGHEVAFEIKYLTGLPPLEGGPNGAAPPRLQTPWALEHPSTAHTSMARDKCARWDAAISQVFGARGLEYFVRLKKKHGDHNAAELRVLQADAKARRCSPTPSTPPQRSPLLLPWHAHAPPPSHRRRRGVGRGSRPFKPAGTRRPCARTTRRRWRASRGGVLCATS